MLGIGIIGVGDMGSKHARIIADYIPKAKVVAVMDKSETCIKSVLKFLDNPKIFNDANQLIDDETVEAVLIASPDSTHANYAEYTIKKGKFLMLEKPLGLNLDDKETGTFELENNMVLVYHADIIFHEQQMYYNWSAKENLPGSSGKITITKNTDTYLEGTFQFEGVGATEVDRSIKKVTEGKFRVLKK